MSQWESVLRELPTLYFRRAGFNAYEDGVFILKLHEDVYDRIHVHLEIKKEYDKDTHCHLKKTLPLLMSEAVDSGISTIYTTIPKNRAKEIKWLTKFVGFVYNSSVRVLSEIDENQILLNKKLRR